MNKILPLLVMICVLGITSLAFAGDGSSPTPSTQHLKKKKKVTRNPASQKPTAVTHPATPAARQ